MKPRKSKLKSDIVVPTTTKGIALLMISNDKGVSIKDRKYRLKTYPCCFVG